MIDGSKLLEYLKEVGLYTEELWHAVNAFEDATRDAGRLEMPNGKYRGGHPIAVAREDPKYFKWYVENGDISPKFKIELEKILEN